MIRRMLRLGVVLGVLAAAGTAHADGYSLHFVTNARLGWTDNLQSAESDESDPPRQADAYTQLMPGFLFTYEKPRFIQELFYEAESNFYLENSDAWTLSHRGGWRGFYLTSPRSEVTTSVVVAGGVLNTFQTSSVAQNGQVTLLPSARSNFGSLEARELYSLQVSRPWRVTQGADARMFTTSTDGVESTGYSLGLGGGVERAFNYNALGLAVQSGYTILGAGSVDPLHQVTGSVTGSWRRDISIHWSSLVDVGVTALVPVDSDDELVVGPTAGAQLSYFPEWGSAGLSVRRTIVPNLYINANTISDFAVLNAYVPLPWFRDRLQQPRFVVGSTIGAGQTSVYDPASGEKYSGFTIGLADVSLDYRIKEQMTMSLRYQYARQDIDEEALMSIDAHSYQRNTVLVTFYARWPERVAAEVPTRGSLRVDRSDATPAGEEINPQGGRPDQQDSLGQGAGRL
jgi:hypothetical protein